MRSAAAATVSLVLAGCYTGEYSTLTSQRAGTRVRVGCLDVVLALVDDETAPSPVILFAFANRCFHQTIVDFSAIRVFAVDADNGEVQLAAYDPHHELKPMQLDALTSGSERVAYDATEVPESIAVCVDLARFDAAARAPEPQRCLAEIRGAR